MSKPLEKGGKSHFFSQGKKKRSKRKNDQPSIVKSFHFDRNSETIPVLVEDCISYLEKPEYLKQEGIFRLSGSQEEINRLKQLYLEGKPVDLHKMARDVNDVTGLLKCFFRELPEAILTWELYECFLAAICIPDLGARMDCLRKVIVLLPPCNRLILDRLLGFLKKVTSNQSSNKMSAQNLAIVFSPTLYRPKEETMEIVIQDSTHANHLIELFITQYESLFHFDQISKSVEGKTTSSNGTPGARPLLAHIVGSKTRTDNGMNRMEVEQFRNTIRKGTLRLARKFLEQEEKQELEQTDEPIGLREQHLLETIETPTLPSIEKDGSLLALALDYLETLPPLPPPPPLELPSLPPITANDNTSTKLIPIVSLPPPPPPPIIDNLNQPPSSYHPIRPSSAICHDTKRSVVTSLRIGSKSPQSSSFPDDKDLNSNSSPIPTIPTTTTTTKPSSSSSSNPTITTTNVASEALNSTSISLKQSPRSSKYNPQWRKSNPDSSKPFSSLSQPITTGSQTIDSCASSAATASSSTNHTTESSSIAGKDPSSSEKKISASVLVVQLLQGKNVAVVNYLDTLTVDERKRTVAEMNALLDAAGT